MKLIQQKLRLTLFNQIKNRSLRAGRVYPQATTIKDHIFQAEGVAFDRFGKSILQRTTCVKVF